MNFSEIQLMKEELSRVALNCPVSESEGEDEDESDTNEVDEDDASFTLPPIKESKINEKRVGVLLEEQHCDDRNVGLLNSSSRSNASFVKFRLQYLFAFAAVMLADGLQGTHLYVLYDKYGFSVSSLYALGFTSGAITSIFTGAIVDRIGRKKAVLVYCSLEILINYLEQYPILTCLVVSRIIGGITTNLLFTVFEAWLVTEHHERKFEDAKLEIILRDSNIVSNLAAIISGYIAHCLASTLGPVGPFVGAVGFTFLALFIVALTWCENYGTTKSVRNSSLRCHLESASKAILNDSNISCTGLIHSLTEGSLQTFIFLWSPMLRSLSSTSSREVPGLDENGEPAYGLIFGSFMLFGALGGCIEPSLVKAVGKIRSFCFPNVSNYCTELDGPGKRNALYILSAGCYLLSSILFLVPCLVNKQSPYAFITVLTSFLLFELLVGTFISSQCIIRSIHIPNESKCSILTMLRVVTNITVAFGVILSDHIQIMHCFGALSLMMVVASILQLSFVNQKRIVKGD